MRLRHILATIAVALMPALAGAQTKHTIQPGETLYRLTVTYNVSADAICAANPGLSASNFKAGTVILIPAAKQAEEEVQPAAQPEQKKPATQPEMHRVARKETLYSIARQYGITVQELMAANRITDREHKLKKGEFLIIPERTEVKPVVVQRREPSTEELIAESKVKAAPKKDISLAVVLPMKQGDQRSRLMLEFYRGVLMAVDSIKHSGVNVDVYGIESGTSVADIRFVLKQHPELAKVDFIIGPHAPEQVPTIAEFCRQNKVRLVVPFSTRCMEVNDNPWVYAMSAQKDRIGAGVAQMATEVFTNHDIIVLHIEGEDEEGKGVVQQVSSAFEARGHKIKSLSVDASPTEQANTFNSLRPNLILVPGNSNRAANQVFAFIGGFLKEHPEYHFSVLGYPEWQNYTSQHLTSFYECDTHLYTTYFRNRLSAETNAFENKYTLWSRRSMSASTPSMALMGFDTAMYFLTGVARYGDGMEQHLNSVGTRPLQNAIHFERVSNWGGFINNRVKMIHYKPTQTIDLMELAD